MRVLIIGLAIATAGLVGVSPALTEDFFQSGWGDTAPAIVSQVDLTNLGAKDLDTPTEPDRFADLLRVDETTVTVAPTVSRTVLSSQTIRKVGYGRVKTVEVVTTPSGVYSSDGIASPHVLYPGIETAPTARKGFETLFALLGGKWLPLSLGHAGSFTTYGSGYGTNYMSNGTSTCVSGKGYFGCI